MVGWDTDLKNNIDRVKIIQELSTIRAMMELDIKKAKQKLSMLIRNIIEQKGVF